MKQLSKKTVISLRDIFVRFDGEVILNNINLDIKEKEFVTILGPSGCGKTTTLRIIGGFVEPESGDVIFDGKRINNLPPNKRNVNTVFQKYSLFPHLNVYDNVAFGLKLKKVPKNIIKEKVTKMLATVDLKLRKSMQLELKEIQQKTEKTFIYVTHDQEEALTMSDTVVVMNNGSIEQIGTPEDIYNEPVNAFVADFIGEANILNGIMIDDCRIKILGKELECVDKGFGKNTPVDVVIRPEDIEITNPEDGQLVGVVENSTFKGVHYEMSVMCDNCEILIHSTKTAEIGSKIGMRVIPFNIQIMNKLLPFYDNVIEAEVSYSNNDDNYFEFLLEGETIKIENHCYPQGTKLKITLPPNALSLAADGIGDLKDVYIESVVYKGEHNEIILESDERKWLMLSDTDEQVATYVPLSFDFSKAEFEVIGQEG